MTLRLERYIADRITVDVIFKQLWSDVYVVLKCTPGPQDNTILCWSIREDMVSGWETLKIGFEEEVDPLVQAALDWEAEWPALPKPTTT